MGLDSFSTLEKFLGAIRSMNGIEASFTFRLEKMSLVELVLTINETGKKRTTLVRLGKAQFKSLTQILSHAEKFFAQADEAMKLKTELEIQRQVKEALERDAQNTQLKSEIEDLTGEPRQPGDW